MLSHLLLLLLLFVLRFGIPAALLALLAYGLRRLDGRWQEEGRAQQQVDPPSPSAVGAGAPAQPATVAELPAVSPSLMAQGPITKRQVLSTPCWQIKQCSEQKRLSCPAFSHPSTLCWLARRQEEGYIPYSCYRCPLFLTMQPSSAPQRQVYH